MGLDKYGGRTRRWGRLHRRVSEHGLRPARPAEAAVARSGASWEETEDAGKRVS